MRTVAVLLGGALVSFAAGVVLEDLLQPNLMQLIIKVFQTPPNSSQWDEIARQWHHFLLITVYITSPFGGFVAGIFVGLLQKKRAILVAASCRIPEFLIGFLGLPVRFWTPSLSGILIYIASHSLPFITAMLAAAVCQRLIRHRVVRRAATNNNDGVVEA